MFKASLTISMQTDKSRTNTGLNAVDKFYLKSLLYKEIYGLIFERVILSERPAQCSGVRNL